MNIDRHGPRPIPDLCHLSYPPWLSLQTTFNVHRYTDTVYSAKKISNYVFLEKELRCLSPNFHIHVSVNDLYIITIGLHIFLQLNRQTDHGKHKVRTYKEYHSVCQPSELGLPPQPPTRRLVCPLPPVSGGRGTLAGEKGVGRVPIPTRGIHCGTLYMYVLCDGKI
jgi:hypothetical protein